MKKHTTKVAAAMLVGAVVFAAAVGGAAAQVGPVDPVRPLDPVKPLDPLEPVAPVDPRGSDDPGNRAVREAEVLFVNALTGAAVDATLFTARKHQIVLAEDLAAGELGEAEAVEEGYHQLAVIDEAEGLDFTKRLRLAAGKQYCIVTVMLPRGAGLIAEDVSAKAGGDLRAACTILMKRWMR